MQANDFLLGCACASLVWSALMFARDVTDEHAERHRRIVIARRRAASAVRTERSDGRAAEGAQAPALPDGNHGENLTHPSPPWFITRNLLRLLR